jgi:hypothetical protein
MADPADDALKLLSENEILNRLADVTAMLHLEQGDGQRLQQDRADLIEHLRARGLNWRTDGQS